MSFAVCTIGDEKGRLQMHCPPKWHGLKLDPISFNTWPHFEARSYADHNIEGTEPDLLYRWLKLSQVKSCIQTPGFACSRVARKCSPLLAPSQGVRDRRLSGIFFKVWLNTAAGLGEEFGVQGFRVWGSGSGSGRRLKGRQCSSDCVIQCASALDHDSYALIKLRVQD